MVVDASAVVAIMRMEPEAEVFLKAIADAQICVMSTVGFLEAAMVLAKGQDTAAIWPKLDRFLAESHIEIAPFDPEQSRLAREAFAKYGKGRHKAGLNLGDCAVYALAMARRMPLLFKGNDFPWTDVPMVLPPPH